MIEYRKALPEDAALLASTRQKAWAATYRGIYPDDMIDDFDYPWHIALESVNLKNPLFHTYFVMDGADCLGYFTFLMKDTPLWRDYHARLLSLYLLPQLQHQGIGRRILEFVRGECKLSGYSKLYLSCAPQNTSALGFYKHMGGIVVAEDVGHENPEEDTVELEFIC